MRQLLQTRSTAADVHSEGVERLRPAAVREHHDQRCLRKRGQRAELLCQHDRLVERREQHHAHLHRVGNGQQPRNGGHRRKRIGERRGYRVVVAEQQRVETGRTRSSRNLEHVARLLCRIERTHRSFDEAAGRQRVERTLERGIGVRPGRIQEAQRGAQLHRGLTGCVAIGDSPSPEPTSPSIVAAVAAHPTSIDVAAAVCAGDAVRRLRSELHRPLDPQHSRAADQGRPGPATIGTSA